MNYELLTFETLMRHDLAGRWLEVLSVIDGVDVKNIRQLIDVFSSTNGCLEIKAGRTQYFDYDLVAWVIKESLGFPIRIFDPKNVENYTGPIELSSGEVIWTQHTLMSVGLCKLYPKGFNIPEEPMKLGDLEEIKDELGLS